ncbi:MAG: hypothetical protein L0332_01250 [Chloroflexi bacterium]|nr:hypothetical protein [Chloroflexota bacterium]MCI0578180.1 hypothetical protein [Chloroflexota bacterium]MCI0649161.1 hypothetical protein [Chloroflexota bacterium]MCI0725348.1 hypothetical protein [Chloroflexota bacterium]
MTNTADSALPDAKELRRLLSYLSIKPNADNAVVDSFRRQAVKLSLTTNVIKTFDLFREAVVESRQFQQIGLFNFYMGLIYLDYERFLVAAEQFNQARRQWAFINEKPHMCLACFAGAVAYHRDLNYQAANRLYARVEVEATHIYREVLRPALLPPVADYKRFIVSLRARLYVARRILRENVRAVPLPVVHINHELTAPRTGQREGVMVNKKALYELLRATFNEEKLRTLCFYLGVVYDYLPAENLQRKFVELMDTMERLGRMPDLVFEAYNQVPDAAWYNTVRSDPLEQ